MRTPGGEVISRATRGLSCFALLVLSFGFPAYLAAQDLDEFRTQVSTFLENHQYEEARSIIDFGLGHFPNDPYLLIAKAVLLAGTDRGGVDRLLQQAEKAAGGDPAILAILGEINMRTGRLAAAIRLFERGLKRDPGDGRIHHQLALIRFFQGEEVEAIQHSERAVELNGTNPDFLRLHALLLQRAGRSAESGTFLRAARRSSPRDPKILLQLSDREMHSGEPAQAMELLELAAALDPENPLFLRGLAEAAQEMGLHDEAAGYCARAEDLEQAFESYSRALRLAGEQQPGEAVQLLEPWVKAYPEFVTGRTLLARLYADLGRGGDALRLSLDTLERDPGNTPALELARRLYLERGELDRALELRRSEPDPNGLLLEGYQKILDGEYGGALEELARVGRTYPLHPGVLRLISLCLGELGRTTDALALLEKAYQVSPRDSAIERDARRLRFERALELENASHWPAALSILTQLNREEPESPDYLLHIGYVQLQMNEVDAAVRSLESGLSQAPGESWARINLARCYYLLARFDDEAGQWERLVKEEATPERLYYLGMSRIRQWRLEEGKQLIAKAANQGFQPARDAIRWIRDTGYEP